MYWTERMASNLHSHIESEDISKFTGSRVHLWNDAKCKCCC